eukprot:TRINITY_DN91146_c0_g1_i1.p1 TRINITY_DN91146_c0_g1~~TRINITY_DN91146_c0_g1_i1.p1  ORF type:complete len:1300 (-),score=434.67 TRINITY_DN91146_c0_g1_i1:105-4004(-)
MDGARQKQKRRKKAEGLGRIERLILHNFKSYEGYHEIGPFDKFTCIIGPNGSGKSNVMDAISFCLGIRAKHLRGDRLKDLVYKREEEDVASNTRTASVTLVFRTSRGEELHFERNITSQGTGQYRVGTAGKVKTVNYDDFLSALEEQEVHVKARNFLVFQGDVMELARRQGQDLAGMLETISGSDRCKEDYERLSRELEVTQERARMHFQHRREMESGVQMLEKQRAEVERYNELKKRRQHLATEAVVYKLFTAELETKRQHSVGEGLREGLSKAELDLRTARKEAEEADVLRKTLETSLEEARSHHFVLASNLEQLRPEIGQCQKQCTHWSAKLREKEVLIADESRRREQLQASAKTALADRLTAEKELARLQEAVAKTTVQMTERQRADYARAVAQVDAANSSKLEQLRELDEQLKKLSDEHQADRRELKEVERSGATAAAKLDELTREKEGIESELAGEGSLLEERQARAEAVVREVQKFTLFRDSLLEEQRALKLRLDAAKARREKLEQGEVRQRIADELRDAFPQGVLGRISELVLPTQRRFELPLQMALGAMAEAFVVTDSAVARQCVQFLKNKRISCETFLPLDRVHEPSVGAMHLLAQGYEARRLAMMCVRPNEKFLENHQQWQMSGPGLIDRALKMLLNGTVIVDDLEEAKATAYVDAKRRKLLPRVVTLEGEVISPNGNMIVQSQTPATRIEFGSAEQLQELRQQEEKLLQVERDLASLQEELDRCRRREAEASDEAEQLQGRHSQCAARRKSLFSALQQEQRLLDAKKARGDELEARLNAFAARKDQLEKNKDKIEAELLKVGKKFFESLNKELGVPDIREVVRSEQREKQRIRAEIEEYEDVHRTLVNQEKSITQKLASASKLEGLRRECEQYKRDIEASKQRQQDLQARLEVLAERCETTKTKVQELTTQKEKAEEDAKARRAEAQTLRGQVDDAKRKVRSHGEKVRVLLAIRCGIFRDCAERGIELPMLLTIGDGDIMPMTKETTPAVLRKVLERDRHLDDLPREEMDAACRSISLDYDILPEARQEQARQAGAFDGSKAVELEYEEAIAQVAKEMEGLSPNMRAVEQHMAEEGRLRDVRQQAEEATTEASRLTREFETVKAERISRFMDCFKHVEACVHPFYRDLTSYDGNDGGSAYLDLDDAEEPYNGGITFTACPPGKRFFPMELLSGGEKSMASMALLFAMHSYRPPPFMILDEVDAPFDRKNTNSLVSYLKKLDFQCLVISLKDSFFAQSDSIVGIFKDKEIQTSGALSLPLKRLHQEFQAPEEAPETEVPDAGGGEDID